MSILRFFQRLLGINRKVPTEQDPGTVRRTLDSPNVGDAVNTKGATRATYAEVKDGRVFLKGGVPPSASLDRFAEPKSVIRFDESGVLRVPDPPPLK